MARKVIKESNVNRMEKFCKKLIINQKRKKDGGQGYI